MAAFDPRQWHEVETDEQIQVPSGMCEVRFSEPGSLWVSTDGGEHQAPASYGTEHRIEVPKSATVVCKTAGAAFVKLRDMTAYLGTDEPAFTNADRLPMYSESYLEVMRARREFELERRQVMAEIRAARASLEASRAEPEPEPQGQEVSEPDPEDPVRPEVVEPDPDPKAKK